MAALFGLYNWADAAEIPSLPAAITVDVAAEGAFLIALAQNRRTEAPMYELEIAEDGVDLRMSAQGRSVAHASAALHGRGESVTYHVTVTATAVTVSFGGDVVFTHAPADPIAAVRYVALSTMSAPAVFHGLDVDRAVVEGAPGDAGAAAAADGGGAAAAAAIGAAVTAADAALGAGGKTAVSVRRDGKAGSGSGSGTSAELPTREYLEKEILPHLQPAFEDLLRLVEQREKDKEAGFEINETFHPLHWLASYLMRKAPIAGAPPPAIAGER